MSTVTIAVILIFFLFIHQATADDDGNTVVDKYVPLGHNFNFSCDAYERSQQKFLRSYSVQWIFRRSKHSTILDNNPNSRFVYDENSYRLIGYDIQREHIGILECRVIYDNSGAGDVKFESSMINIKIQDCNEDIDSNITHSLRNPCRFGQCKIVFAKLGGIVHEKLYCDCVEHYTGLYCDVEKIGTWWREILYYSSTFGHFICTGIIFLCFYCFNRSNSKERISLKDDVPDFGRVRDNMDLLYPAARKRRRQPSQSNIPPLGTGQPQLQAPAAGQQPQAEQLTLEQQALLQQPVQGNVNPQDLLQPFGDIPVAPQAANETPAAPVVPAAPIVQVDPKVPNIPQVSNGAPEVAPQPSSSLPEEHTQRSSQKLIHHDKDINNSNKVLKTPTKKKDSLPDVQQSKLTI